MVQPGSRAFVRATSFWRSTGSRSRTRRTRRASCRPSLRVASRRSFSGAAMPRSSSPSRRISEIVRERGPLTVAAFMDLALYDADAGYYARAAQRSGRAGDFFTSVDVGPVFGELLSVQILEMVRLLEPRAASPGPQAASPEPRVDLVEAGAGNGRLSADVLRAIRRRDAAAYVRLR